MFIKLKKTPFEVKPTPFKEAGEVLRNKPVLTSSIFSKLSPEIKACAFAIRKIESADTLQNVRDIIARFPEGENWNDSKKKILDEIKPFFEPKAAGRRAELLLRIHGLNAYRVGQWELAQETKSALPYFKYIATMDSKTRPSHAALHGLVLPVDDPFWDTHMPPGWDWFCRCQVVQISEYDKKEQQKAEEILPPERRRVLSESQIKELRSGKIQVGPTEKIDVRSRMEKGASGPYSLKSLRFPQEEILKRCKTPEEKEAFLKSLEIPIENYKQPYTVRDWFEGKALPEMVEGKTYYRPVIDSINIHSPKNYNFEPVVSRVGELINKVHFDGLLPKVGLYEMKNPKSGVLGSFNPKKLRIEINTLRQKNAVNTLLHEMGHFIDFNALGKGKSDALNSRLTKDLMNEILQSNSVMRLFRGKNRLKKYSKDFEKIEHYEYLLKKEELFARAYTQYILTKNKISTSTLSDHWKSKEFEPIKNAFDEMFKQIGWL